MNVKAISNVFAILCLFVYNLCADDLIISAFNEFNKVLKFRLLFSVTMKDMKFICHFIAYY